MLWILCSVFFCWLIYHELTGRTPIYKPYLIGLIILALLAARPPYRYWCFERKLNVIAQQLAQPRPATVHCNTLWDTLFDEEPRVGGHADPVTGYIVTWVCT